MKLVWTIALLAWLAPAGALAQTPTWSGPFSQTSPAQNGTMTCTQPSAPVLQCTLSAALLAPDPIITPATFTVSLPLSIDELIGTLTMANGPFTAITVISGDSGNPTLNPPGYFNVWPLTQHIRVNETAGATLPPAGTYHLMVTATNANGTGAPAAITVIVP